MRVLAALASAVVLIAAAAGCSEEREEAPAADEEMVAPGAAEGAAVEEMGAGVEDEEPLELGEGLEDDEEPVPLDEMDQAMLETACFEGRQDACDRLGH